MIYLTIHRKDGFGVYYLTIMKAIIFCKERNITYLHTPSTYIAHHNDEPDFPLIMEKFLEILSKAFIKIIEETCCLPTRFLFPL